MCVCRVSYSQRRHISHLKEKETKRRLRRTARIIAKAANSSCLVTALFLSFVHSLFPFSSLATHRLHHCLERVRLRHSHVGQDLAIERDIRTFQPRDKPRVVHAILLDSGADALNPDGTELALLHLSVPVGVLQGLLDALHGHAEAVGPPSVALGHFDDFLVSVVGEAAGLLQEGGGEGGQRGKGAGAGGDACMGRDGRGGPPQEEAAQPRRGHDDDGGDAGEAVFCRKRRGLMVSKLKQSARYVHVRAKGGH